jgi:phage gpG-like protein
MSLDLGSLSRALQADRKAVAEATRPAAQAGAQVLYEAVGSNVRRIRKRTGKLAASIYQAYATNESVPGTATYYVSWRTSGKAGLPRAPHGHLVEFGFLQRYEITRDPKTGRFFTHKDRPLPAPRQVPAQPFVRPAAAQQPAALAAAEKRFRDELAQKGLLS